MWQLAALAGTRGWFFGPTEQSHDGQSITFDYGMHSDKGKRFHREDLADRQVRRQPCALGTLLHQKGMRAFHGHVTLTADQKLFVFLVHKQNAFDFHGVDSCVILWADPDRQLEEPTIVAHG